MTVICKNCSRLFNLSQCDLNKIKNDSQKRNSLQFCRIVNGEFLCIKCAKGFYKNCDPEVLQSRIDLHLDVDLD